MPHFFVDDAFGDSKEVMAIPARYRNAAVGLWTRCGAWSASKLTDGVVPMEVVRMFGGRQTSILVRHLGAVRLWDAQTDTECERIVFRNWSKWQRTREQVCAYREAQAEKKRRQRQHTKTEPASTDSEMSPGDSTGDNPGDTNSCPPGTPQTPIPIPIPTPISTSVVALVRGGPGGNTTTRATTRGTRLPDSWTPPQHVVAQMRSDHPHIDLKAEHAKFIDYWHARAGKEARKADWPATWRNWIRRAAENTNNRTPHTPTNGIGKPTQKALGYQNTAERLIAEMENHE